MPMQRGRPETGRYLIRRHKTQNGTSAVITVPASVARQMAEDIVFEFELTDEGMFYRVVGKTDETPIAMPDWAVKAEGTE